MRGQELVAQRPDTAQALCEGMRRSVTAQQIHVAVAVNAHAGA